ncbi:nucleolar pre-ribosomal-associated protein 1 [Biomphalaria glabrata]|nr:collectin-11-like; partial [Biomphalaria glabrata]
MSYLISLSLYFAKNKPETEQINNLESHKLVFSYLASINSFDSIVNVERDNSSSLKYFGQINRSNASFLRLIWEYPDSRQAGVYKCEANGINVIGKPVSLTAESSVTAVDPDTKRMITELQKLSRMVEGIQLRVNSSETRIEFLESESQLKFFRQQAVEEALFVVIPEFQGRKYMLTKNRLLMTADQAVMLCGMFDGYLAEIDTEAEYNYLRDHMFKPSSFDYVVTGATDEKNRRCLDQQHYFSTSQHYFSTSQHYFSTSQHLSTTSQHLSTISQHLNILALLLNISALLLNISALFLNISALFLNISTSLLNISTFSTTQHLNISALLLNISALLLNISTSQHYFSISQHLSTISQHLNITSQHLNIQHYSTSQHLSTTSQHLNISALLLNISTS